MTYPTPNNQDRLLSDEELNEEINDISSDWFVERSGKPVLSKRLEANDKYLTRMRDLINTQKRLYAESVIGEKGTRLSKLGNTLCDELIDEQRARIK